MDTRFKGENGLEWHPKMTVSVLMKGCKASPGMTLTNMIGLDFGPAEIMEFLWAACEKEAKERGISRDDFFEGIGLRGARDGAVILVNVVNRAFLGTPESEVANGS